MAAKKRHSLRLELQEPISDTYTDPLSIDAVVELRDYLENEFNNHGIRVHMSVIEDLESD
jgi:hypothetical protein